MRSEADGVVVLLRAKPEWAGTNFFKDFDECVDAWIAVSAHRADQGVRCIVEKVGFGMGETSQFTASHGMTAKEERATFFGEKFASGCGDAEFCAAGIGDQRVRGSVTANFG